MIVYIRDVYVYSCVACNTFSSLPAQAPALLSVSSAVWVSPISFPCTYLNPTNKDDLKFLIFQEANPQRALRIYQVLMALKYLWIIKGIVCPLLWDLMMFVTELIDAWNLGDT